MNIPEIIQKGKTLITPDVYIVTIIVLVGFAGFGLGRLSKVEEVRVPVAIINSQTLTGSAISAINESTGGIFVASKNGTKYHFPWCSGAQRMKESNKIWFSSKEEAIRAGYTPALNCKGL
ncbi:hypothetical protein IIB50_01650 [Patescibacteria group bacterium]|nr:hypothetical protein [Patescibacteria group bacterium]